MPDIDKVFIKGLVLDLSVGIYDHEKAARQRVIVNATFGVESNKGKALDSIEAVVSYELAVQHIRVIAESRHYDLLEALAEDIVKKLSQDNRIKHITLSLEKPDIIAGVQGVGVEISRVLR